jgi:hypothetical protein
MDKCLVINEDSDFDLEEVKKVNIPNDIPWPPPNLSAIDLPLAFLYATIKARATIPRGLFAAQYNKLLQD